MVSKDATKALWLIAETADTDQVESLLKDGADINASNVNGTTALMRAVTQGHSPMVRALLEHGADPNQSRNDKFTPLILAAFFGHHDIVKLLVEYGADTCAVTRFDTSAQMWASARTFQDVARYLGKLGTTDTVNKPWVENCGSSISPIQTEEKTSSVRGDGVNLRMPGFAFETAAQKNDRRAASDGSTRISSVATPVAQSEIDEAAPALFLEPWSSSSPQRLARKLLVYSLTSLVLLVALIVGFARRSSHSTVVSDQSVVPTNTVKKVEEATASAGSDVPAGGVSEQQSRDATKDQKTEDNDAGRTKSKERFVVRSEVSSSDLLAGQPMEEPKEIAKTEMPRSMPDENAGDIHDPSLASVSPVTAPTPKPQPVSRVNGARKGTAPLSPVLISPSKNATTKTRTIQWP